MKDNYEIAILIAYFAIKSSNAGIRVAGGEAILDNLLIEVGDALHLSGGTTMILGGTYKGGVDFNNEYLNKQTGGLNLLSDWMDSPVDDKYSGDNRLPMKLEGEKDADTAEGQQLAVPVLIVLPLPENVNPALITVLHHDGAPGKT